MTHEECIISIEKYYGKFQTIFVREILMKYLVLKFNENDMNKLFDLLTEKFSTKWKVAPCKADIIEMIESYNSENWHCASTKETRLGLGNKEIKSQIEQSNNKLITNE